MPRGRSPATTSTRIFARAGDDAVRGCWTPRVLGYVDEGDLEAFVAEYGLLADVQLERGVEECGYRGARSFFCRDCPGDRALRYHVPKAVDSSVGNEAVLYGYDRLMGRDHGGEGEVGPVAVTGM